MVFGCTFSVPTTTLNSEVRPIRIMINVSYHVMVAYFLLSHFTTSRAEIMFLHGGSNTVSTDDGLAQLEREKKISKEDAAKLARRQAAHHNCYEAMVPFYASIVSPIHLVRADH
jgi:hypothetical protein